jgi:VanZ family protein
MPTERFACLATGVGIMLALLIVGAHRVPHGWDTLAHVLCFALITALLWRGTAGRAPLAVLACVLAFGALDELHQTFLPGRSAEPADFFADALAAACVAGALFIRGKYLCAESSEP